MPLRIQGRNSGESNSKHAVKKKTEFKMILVNRTRRDARASDKMVRTGDKPWVYIASSPVGTRNTRQRPGCGPRLGQIRAGSDPPPRPV